MTAAAGVVPAAVLCFGLVEVYLAQETEMDAQSNVMAQRQQEAGRVLARLREVLPPVWPDTRWMRPTSMARWREAR